MRARLRSVLSVNVSDAMQNIRVPALYLRATCDRLVPNAASQLITRHKPESRVVDIEGPHFLLQASAAEAARVVHDFVREHGEGLAHGAPSAR